MGLSIAYPIDPFAPASPEHSPPRPPRLTMHHTGQHPRHWKRKPVSDNLVEALMLLTLSLPDAQLTVAVAENLEERVITCSFTRNENSMLHYNFQMPSVTYSTQILPRVLEKSNNDFFKIENYDQDGSLIPSLRKGLDILPPVSKSICTRASPL